MAVLVALVKHLVKWMVVRTKHAVQTVQTIVLMIVKHLVRKNAPCLVKVAVKATVVTAVMMTVILSVITMLVKLTVKVPVLEDAMTLVRMDALVVVKEHAIQFV